MRKRKRRRERKRGPLRHQDLRPVRLVRLKGLPHTLSAEKCQWHLGLIPRAELATLSEGMRIGGPRFRIESGDRYNPLS